MSSIWVATWCQESSLTGCGGGSPPAWAGGTGFWGDDDARMPRGSVVANDTGLAPCPLPAGAAGEPGCSETRPESGLEGWIGAALFHTVPASLSSPSSSTSGSAPGRGG